ncbi:cysteine hydrolase [Cryptosporangium aurantiacum]|uniref:Nicotinamidase-related amidase n=1 Tax=Cryptosporangium aurantiacum TaxID=134849 RepID=A0A1M7R4G1_9ACTN|nr:cysteine hydrolase [Cryptosporangium aurantiacum]SHN39887.1 Nicotinamidase-related amidase [Cryptosporangium aurantiacum]
MAVRGLDRGQRPALVISECQNGITNLAYEQSPLIEQVTERGIIPRIDVLAGAFRAAGLPVIHVTIAAPPGFVGFRVNCALAARIAKQGKLVTGTPYAAVHDDLPLHDGDRVLERMHGMAPFTGTELDAVLRGHDVDTVVLAGVSTNIALPGAATEAVALGYEVVLVEDCTAGGTAESHQAQISLHLPLLATITHGAAVTAALGSE